MAPTERTGFKFVGGRPCLDFINTVSGRVTNPGTGRRDYQDLVETERMLGIGDLATWARAAQLLDRKEAAELEAMGDRTPGAAARIMTRVRNLREAMYRVFKAAVEGWTPEPQDLEVLNRELLAARSHEQITRTPAGFAWTWAGEDDSALDRVLRPVLRSAAELLTSDQLDRVTQCGGEDCHWLFLDTSKNRSRRWCEMSECGNRAKVRRFRERQ